ncbi:hypothetical protein F53441_4956 [Fusarium austroafricanum]|uniref:BZIP domain-containing protein n=1 Tax=Fusarium austroafricanum TaxID=2364996 RepID=A0A8H4P158_9HYPO|nr:hypothetical protein F53441_4956 [Fusarium austroafricanum]
MAPAHQAPSISKWSLKPPDHGATRIRDNQRRHRARVKARITSLETDLAKTQQELRKAQARINELEDLLSDRYCTDGRTVEQPLVSEQPGLSGGALGEQGCHDCFSRPINLPLRRQDHDQSPPSTETPTQDPSLPPASQSTTNPTIVSLIARYDEDSRLPVVAPGESTTLCELAFEIISQQSMTNIDICDVEQWLWPGFRQATKQGEGCRVDTKLLYTLIDHLIPL